MTIEQVFVASDAQSPELSSAVSSARAAGVSVAMLADGVLEKVADAVTPQGCAAIAPATPMGLSDISFEGLVLILDDVRDPGNLGAVARVAEAAGCSALVLTGSPVDPFGPKALRGSTGSMFRLPVVEAGPIAPLLEVLVGRGVVTVATSSHEGEDFAAFDWPGSVAIVLGNEATGLDATSMERCTHRITIPIAATVESLNLSVTAGVLAFAAVRRLTAQRPSTQVLR